MASITASTSALCAARAGLMRQGAAKVRSLSLSRHLVLAAMTQKGGIRCSMEKKQTSIGIAAASVMAACAWVTTLSSPALALVDERMSTEGTGLPFGLSNSILGWILFGVFGLIWSVYFVYTSTLEEDEDSGLSL